MFKLLDGQTVENVTGSNSRFSFLKQPVQARNTKYKWNPSPVTSTIRYFKYYIGALFSILIYLLLFFKTMLPFTITNDLFLQKFQDRTHHNTKYSKMKVRYSKRKNKLSQQYIIRNT